MTVFLGAPGSGKGTQAKRLSQGHQFVHLSTGDILRAAVKNRTEVGMAAKSFIDLGELVPDDVMIRLIESSLAPLKNETKVVLDGFPRTVHQCEALDKRELTKVNKAVYFKIPVNRLIERLTGRRVCEQCGEPYHLSFLPPKVAEVCGQCGGKLIQRADDGEEVVKRRLAVFDEQNSRLLTYYSGKRKLVEIDATKSVEVIQTQLVKMLN